MALEELRSSFPVGRVADLLGANQEAATGLAGCTFGAGGALLP